MDTNIRTNTKKVSERVLYPELSFDLVGILFDLHKKLGLYGREKQYSDALEEKLKIRDIPYQKELHISGSGNVVDFLISEKIILELKAKRTLTPEDYRQLQHYLQETGIRLGLLVNFREKYIRPIRIIRIDNPKKIQCDNARI